MRIGDEGNHCGVPQGSILGPLLFIIYVNFIINASDVLEFILFADDTTILYSHKHIESQIKLVNKELNEVCNWFKATKLYVNASKTKYMILGTPHMTSVKQTDSTLDNTMLNRVQYTKILYVLNYGNKLDLIWFDVMSLLIPSTPMNHRVHNNIMPMVEKYKFVCYR